MSTSTQPSLNPATVAHVLGGRATGNRVAAPAPGHSKHDRSLSILIDPSAPDGFLLTAWAGEDSLAMKDYVRGKLGMGDWAPGEKQSAPVIQFRPATAPRPFSDAALLRGGYHFVCAYPYEDADGAEAFEVCRYEHPTRPKTFLARHTDAAGNLMSGRGEPILYRLNEIASRPDEPVYVVEGEKDADNLAALGVLATTVPSGSWPSDLSALEGRTVYVLADNDKPGEEKAEKAMEHLAPVADARRVNLPGLPPKGDVTDWLEAGGTAAALAELASAAWPQMKAANDNKPIRATPFVLRETALIPPREWLYGRHYVRKYMGTTFGAGGGGKSAHAVSETLAMVTGRPLLGGDLQKPLRVWYINLEDPAEEIERRFGGAAKHFRVTAEQIADRLFTDSGRDQEFVVMRLDGRNTKVCEPVVKQIIAEIKARHIDVLIVDPFVSTHEVEENDNTRIQQVAALWVRIADEANCSVELIHHVSKGNTEITAESGRGAGALKDKARSVRVINPMSESEAGNAGLPKEESASHFRVDFGKANLGKRAGQSAWRKFASVALGNGKGLIKAGDMIGVVEPWQWPSAASLVEDVPAELLAGIKARLGAGSYRESEQSADWAGHLIGELMELDTSDATEKKRVKRMLTAWIAAGELAIEMRPDQKRTPRKHIVPSASPP